MWRVRMDCEAALRSGEEVRRARMDCEAAL